MTAKVIQLRPHKPVEDAQSEIVIVIDMIRRGLSPSVIELALCKIADDLLDYVETQQGR